MRDLMVDLETLGTSPGSVVLSIGARVFDPRRQQRGTFFYKVINLASSLEAGFVSDPQTIEWWGKQSTDARAVLDEANDPMSAKIGEVLRVFNAFIKEELESNPRVWGNGAAFDNVILRAAYNKISLTPAWSYRDDVCYRTLRALAPQVEPQRLKSSIAHHALDDADQQVTHMFEIYKFFGWAFV